MGSLNKYKPANDKEQISVKVSRTAEGTAFEIAIAVLNIVMWGLIALFWHKMPEQIPVHFDITGHPDGYGGRLMLLPIGSIGTFVAVLLCVCAYNPAQTLSLPVRLRNTAQYALGVRLIRIMGLLITLLFISIVLNIVNTTSGHGGIWGKTPVAIVVGILVVSVWYTVKIRRRR